MRFVAFLARREVLFGAAAGLLAGVVFALAMQAEEMRVEVTGLAGASTSGAGLIVHLALAALIGAAVGLQYRHEPGSYAAQITLGVTFGLLGWIVGPLTIRPLAEGQVPDWSIAVAAAGFPSLMGHMLYGALTTGGLYWAVHRWGGGGVLGPSGRARGGSRAAHRGAGRRLRGDERGADAGAHDAASSGPGRDAGESEQLPAVHADAGRSCFQRAGGAAHRRADSGGLSLH